jgi:hypothetical protein
MSPRNRYAEAFKENFNIVGLAGAVAVAAATLTPLLLLPVFVLEAAYLIFVPDSRWYASRLAQRHDAAIEARRAQMKAQILPLLRPSLQSRYLRLEELRRQIGTMAMDEQNWFREVLRKLDYLLDKFLQFASKEVQFRQYLISILAEARGVAPFDNSPLKSAAQVASRRSSWLDEAFDDAPRGKKVRRNGNANGTNGAASGAVSGPAGRARPTPIANEETARFVPETVEEVQSHYDRELQDLKDQLAKEGDVGTRAVLEKRLEVLQRRREFVGRMGRIVQNLDHQLGLLEDTFGLISDEIRARPPEQVLADIEDVVTQTNTMTQVLEEIAPFEQSLAKIGI